MHKQQSLRAVQKNRSSNLLKKAVDFRLHSSENQVIAEHFYRSLDTPVSLSCYMLLKYSEFDQLVSKDINPKNYEDPYLFRDDFAAVSYLRKSASLKTSFDCKSIALESFKDSEQRCYDTNHHLLDYLNGRLISGHCEQPLTAAIRKIDRILGDFDIDELLDECGWGPGVTLSVKGDDTSASRKFDGDRNITVDAYDLFGSICEKAYPTWDAWTQPYFVGGNTIITVAKNAKTDRTIAIEPGLNSWIQKGIGKVIRKRLRRAGFNLDSDLKNQRGAYLGSLSGLLATIDFTAASDSISVEAVRLLLPSKWFSILNAVRSKNYSLNGETKTFSKFSSMGNGFTFELESLIFVTCALAICEAHSVSDLSVSVFGDDIILPSELVASYTDLVTFLGFRVNDKKSFSSGYFRESCGSYYFNGVDVKPIFNKKDLKNVKDVFRLANAVRLLSHRRNSHYGCDIRLRSHWSFLIHRCPLDLRLFGPMSGGDAVLHGNMCEAVFSRPKDCLEGFLFRGFPEVSLDIDKYSHGVLLQRLSSSSKDLSYNNRIPLRARTRMVFKKNMFVSLWYELGPWY
jgi:hypothetical protein